MNRETQHRLQLARRCAFAAAALAAVLTLLGWWFTPRHFFEAYLVAFLTVSGVSLGCLAMLMIWRLVGGRWGRVAAPMLKAGTWPLLAMPLFALPLLPGVVELYPWARADASTDPLLLKKAAYLNLPFFYVRAAIYFLLWSGLAFFIGTRPSKPPQPGRFEMLSAAGLATYAFTMTFASIDWMMSLEPHWFSAIYGVIVMAGQAAAGLAIAVIGVACLGDDSVSQNEHGANPLRDLANLLLAAIAFWMYVSFSQFLIIWSGNLTEEIPWYLTRSTFGWNETAWLLALLHFVLPFMALLNGTVKNDRRTLAAIAGVILTMHAVDVYWLTMPALRPYCFVYWLDVTAIVGLGGAWLGLALWRYEKQEQTDESTDTSTGRQPA